MKIKKIMLSLLFFIPIIIIFFSCSDFELDLERDRLNPFDPGYNEVIPHASSIRIYKLAINKIEVKWSAPLDTLDGRYSYRIDKQIDSLEWIENYKEFSSKILSFVDSNDVINKQITYRIFVKYDENISKSIEQPIINIFYAPTIVSITQETLYSARIIWVDNNTGEEKFEIERKLSTEPETSYIKIGEITGNDSPGTTRDWVDTTLVHILKYNYRIRAVKGQDYSLYGDRELSMYFPPPTNLTVTQNNVNTFTLVWNDNSIGEEGFKIERKIDDGNYSEIAAVPTSTFIDSTVTKKGYGAVYYQVKGYKGIYSTTYTMQNSSVIFPAPTNLISTQLSITSVLLSWTDNSIGEDKFDIERKLSTETAYLKIGECSGSDAITKSWSDNSIEPGLIYDYNVRAIKGLNSSLSVERKGYRNEFKAPSDLTVIQNNVNTFTLAWTDNSVGEDGFKIERKIDDGIYTEISTTTDTAYVDSTVKTKANQTVYYQVKAYKDLYSSEYAQHSSVLSIPQPTNLICTKPNISLIVLNWTDNSTGEEGFYIDKKIEGGNWGRYETVAANSENWYDTDVELNTNVYYSVYAYKGINTSAHLNSTFINTTFPTPSNLIIQNGIYTFNISWTDNSVGEERFEVERKLSSDSIYTKVTEVVGDDLETKSWVDTTAVPNLTYDYRIKGVFKSYSTNYIEKINCLNEFKAPSDLTVIQNNVNTFTLAWTDNSVGEDGFKIERKIDDGIYTEISTTTDTTYVDSTVAKKGYGTVYYRIKGYKNLYGSTYAEQSSAVSFPQPTNLICTKPNISLIVLNWTDNSTGEDGFYIDKKIEGGMWGRYASVAANSENWYDTDVELNTNVYYSVYAYKGINTSSHLNSTFINTAFPSPSNLIIQNGIFTFNIAWTDNSVGEERFEIERKISSDSTYTKVAEIIGDDLESKNWVDTTALPNLTYDYRIKGVYKSYSTNYIEKINCLNEFKAPSDLIIQNGIFTLNLLWKDNSVGEERFEVERKISSDSTYNKVAEIIGDDLETKSWVDTTAVPNLTYDYRIKGVFKSYSTNYIEKTDCLNEFKAPSGLTVSQENITSALLVWTDNSIGESKFEIERKLTSESSYSKVAEVVGDNFTQKSWIDIDLVPNLSYDYRIKAVYGSDGTSYETESFTNTFLPPTDLISSIISPSQMKLTWRDNSIGEEGFIIDRKIGVSGAWIQNYSTVGANTNTWTDSTLIADYIYYFRVRAYNSSYYSGYSNEVYFVLNFISIPSGSFSMGSVVSSDEQPIHTVNILKEFYVCKYEVTQKEWKTIMGSNPASNYGIGDNLPVYYVSWYAILKYCNLRSSAESLTPCYTINGSTNPADWGSVPTSSNATWNLAECDFNANGYRLPTEAEWEYAARYNDGRTYPWGGTAPSSTLCNYNGNIGATTAVGSYPSGNSQLGLFDMAGNVYEWVWDWFATYPSTTQTDPIGPTTVQNYRVLRGGSWSYGVTGIRSADRTTSYPNYVSGLYGFRLARTK